MKNTLILLLVLIVFSTTAFARPVKRIKFAKGATETIVSGKLNNFKDSQTYLINLRADETFTIEDAGDNPITISVFDPSGKNVDDYDLSCHGKFNLPKTKKGDYRIVVTECKKADPWKGTFKIKVSATLAKTTERIDFEKAGSMSLVWEQMMQKGSTKTYVFRGKKGQTVSLALIEDTGKGKMNFDNFGSVDISGVGDNAQFKLTEDRDYYFTVINDSTKQTSFRISINVTDSAGNPIRMSVKNTISAANWKKMPGLGDNPLLLAIGAGNDVWAVDVNNAIYKLENNKWTKTDFGGLPEGVMISHIAIDPDGFPWAIANTNIYQLVNNRWAQMPGRANDIFISPLGLVWIVGASDKTGAIDNNPILQWNETTRKWVKTKDPEATQIAESGGADAAYLLSIRNDSSVWVYGSPDNAHSTGGKWTKMPGVVGWGISIGGDGTAWLLGDTERNAEECFGLYRLDNVSNTWKKMEGKAQYVAADMNGKAWIINRDGNIYQ